MLFRSHGTCEIIYQWLVFHYNSLNNSDSLVKYTSISNKNYPQSDYFDLNYIDWLLKEKQYAQTFPIFKDLFARGFKDKENQYAYIQDLFSFIYDKTDSTADKYIEKELFKNELTRYISKFPSEIEPKLLFAKYYNNQAIELQNELKFKKTAQLSRKRFKSCLKQSDKYLREILASKVFPNTTPPEMPQLDACRHPP